MPEPVDPEVLLDLRERVRLYASLTDVGVSREALQRALTVLRTESETPMRGQTESESGAGRPVQPSGVAPHAADAPAMTLDQVRTLLGNCQRCKLAKTRQNVVFGQGNPDARLMFVGEAPGADEDEQGLAFVGRAGQLLTDIIEKGLKIPRSEVFIANILKSRPPGNRNPEPDEIAACSPFLDMQIDAIKPEVIVGLGKFAAQWLLKTAEPITRLRGRLGEYKGVRVMPTYHPAYLLRNPSAKKDVWEDVKVVRALLNL